MDILCRLDSRLRSDDNANMSIITPVSVTWCEKKSSGNSEQILVGSEEQSLPKNWKIQQVVGIIPEKLFYKGKYFGPKLPTFLPVFMLFLSILTHFENKMYKILALRANFEHTFTFDLISSQNREEIRKFPLAGGGEIWDFGLSIYPWLFSSGEMTEMTAGSGDQFLPNRVERVAVLAHLTPPETVYH